MKTSIVAVFAVLFAVAQALGGEDPPLIMLEGASYNPVEVPKSGTITTTFEMTKEVAALGGAKPTVEYSIDFSVTDIGRYITLNGYAITAAGENKSFIPVVYDKTGHFVLNVDGCSEGCKFYFVMNAECGGTCLFGITTTQWVRTIKTDGTHIFSNIARPYMPLHYGLWSPILEVADGNNIYFEYTRRDSDPDYVFIEKTSSISLKTVFMSGGNENEKPSPAGGSKWFNLLDRFYGELYSGTNFFGVTGENTAVRGDLRVKIGAASPLSVSFLLVALFAISALLF